MNKFFEHVKIQLCTDFVAEKGGGLLCEGVLYVGFYGMSCWLHGCRDGRATLQRHTHGVLESNA